MHAIQVHFIDEASNVRIGELINVNYINDDGHVEIEFTGDHEVDIMSILGSDDHIFRAHISKVSAMFPVAQGLPLLTTTVRLFDQDA